jgi:squalene-associated FAD-dependent desaturase
VASSDSRECVVIGAGLAGLASAVWLTEAGHRVTLLERRNSLGGRTHAIHVPQVDDLADNGQHVVTTVFESLLRYLDSVGTRQFVRFQPGCAIRFPGGKTGRFDLDLAGLTKIAAGRSDGVPWHDVPATMAAQTRLTWEIVRQPADLDEITCDEWFDRIGMPHSARPALWAWFAVGVLNEKTHIASAKSLADILTTGFRNMVRMRSKFWFGAPTVDFDTLYVHGAERVIEQGGGKIVRRGVAKVITVEDGHVTGVKLADGTRIDAELVISAVPNWNISGLLDEVPERARIYEAAQKLGSVPIVSVNLYLDRELGTADAVETLHGGIGKLEQVFDRQKLYDREPHGTYLYCLTINCAHELNPLTNEQITDHCLDTLREYFPGARDAQVVHSHVVRMPRSTISVGVGTAKHRLPQRTSVRGLALAGDWTETGWPGTMEGAAVSAQRAVTVVLDDIAAGLIPAKQSASVGA